MPQNLDINRIVEKVLDQIAREAKGRNNNNNIVEASPAAKNSVKPKSGGCEDNGEELFVADRVVSLGRIEKQLAGKKRLAITPGAVLTPSVRDYLKENRISICTAMPKLGTKGQKPLSIIAGLTSYDPTELGNRLSQQRFDVTASSCGCLIETTDTLAEQLADPNQLGVVLTTHHAVTLCLANRHKTLRAVSIDNEDQVEPIVSTVGANLIVVSARGRSCFQLERIIARFARMANHTCPEVLKSRL